MLLQYANRSVLGQLLLGFIFFTDMVAKQPITGRSVKKNITLVLREAKKLTVQNRKVLAGIATLLAIGGICYYNDIWPAIFYYETTAANGSSINDNSAGEVTHDKKNIDKESTAGHSLLSDGWSDLKGKVSNAVSYVIDEKEKAINYLSYNYCENSIFELKHNIEKNQKEKNQLEAVVGSTNNNDSCNKWYCNEIIDLTQKIEGDKLLLAKYEQQLKEIKVDREAQIVSTLIQDGKKIQQTETE